MNRIPYPLVALALALFVFDAAARPRIGLVLSGGGARGLAHIGVLKVLEELRIPIDAIAATSMGAVVGGGYTAGVDAAQMEDLVIKLDWADIFTDNPPRPAFSNRRKRDERKALAGFSIGYRDGALLFPQGILSGQKMDRFLRQLAANARDIRDFDKLPVPYRAIATDLVSGQLVVFDSGALETAMRASMSIPGVIAPTELGGQLLVDGGLVRNLPVDIVRGMGVDTVIAVNLGTPLLKREALSNVIGVTAQMIAILTEQNVQASLASLDKHDILILPELDGITAADFARAADAIASGEQAARRAADSLRRYSLSRSAYQRWRQRFAGLRRPQTPRTVDEIRIAQLHRANPDAVKALMQTQPGQPIDVETLQQDMQRIYGSGDFERVSYRFIDEAGRNVLVVDAYEKSWGPNYLRFGSGFSSDFQNNTEANVLLSYNQTWLNELGAEWQSEVQIGTTQRLRSEFHQPLAARPGWFLAPYMEVENRLLDVFDGQRRIAEYEVRSASAGVDLGYDFGSDGEARVGVQYALIDAQLDAGAGDLPEFDAVQGAFTARYVFDQLDDLDFPSTGSGFSVDVYAARGELGSDLDYGKLEGAWVGAVTRNKNRWVGGLKAGTELYGDIPVYDQFALGGFLQLSGYQSKQLRGEFMGLARLIYYRELAQLAGAFGGEVYAGASLEAGNVWGDRDDIGLDGLRYSASLFVGANTLLGPFYLGYGLADDGEASFYLLLGRP